MTYSDPENKEDIMKEIIKSPTIKEVVELINGIFPGFLRYTLPSYSKDYPHYDINWQAMCMTMKTKKAAVILVDDFPEDESHILAKTFCEIFTQAGFMVRKYTEFLPCIECGAAIPTEESYEKLKELKISVPTKWYKKCSTC
jgi:hypothetical protein